MLFNFQSEQYWTLGGGVLCVIASLVQYCGNHSAGPSDGAVPASAGNHQATRWISQSRRARRQRGEGRGVSVGGVLLFMEVLSEAALTYKGLFLLLLLLFPRPSLFFLSCSSCVLFLELIIIVSLALFLPP